VRIEALPGQAGFTSHREPTRRDAVVRQPEGAPAAEAATREMTAREPEGTGITDTGPSVCFLYGPRPEDSWGADADALQKLVDAMPAQVAVVGADWRILTANAAWAKGAKTSPHPPLLAIGQSYRRFCEWSLMSGAREAEAVLAGLREIDEGRSRQLLRTFRSSIDGQYYHISITRFETDGVEYATISRLNVTELLDLRRQRLQLSASLMRAQASLMRAQEEERQRVARELHDTAAQYLVAMSLSITRLRQTGKEVATIAVADEISGLLDQFHRELRGLTYVMHPPQLEQGGLHAAIEALCSGFADRAGLDISLKSYGIDRKRCGAVESTVYRIVQEALSNIHRHAHASHVRIRLSDRDDALYVVVEDDGAGLSRVFDAVEDELSVLGVGIAGMFARVGELGGRLTIRNRRSGRPGVVVSAMVPRHGTGQAFLSAPQPAQAA
jgi:signal transduction histidine kinase